MLTLAAVHTAKFNSDFYVVVATVIPIYFIALMVAPGMLRWHIRGAHAERSRMRAAKTREELRSRRKRTLAAGVLNVVAIYLVQFACVIGELSALGALDSRQSGGFVHTVVWASIILVVLGSGLSATSQLYSSLLEDSPIRSDNPESRDPGSPGE